MKVYFDNDLGVLIVDERRVSLIASTIRWDTADADGVDSCVVYTTETNITIIPRTKVTSILDVNNVPYVSREAFGLAVSNFMNPRNIPFYQKVAEGNVFGYDKIEKFGENPALATADGFEPIWDGGTSYTAPTQARIHDIVSDSIEDIGAVVSSGDATGGSNISLIDTGATFETDGVQVGDYLLNDTDVVLGSIIDVVSETELTLFRMSSPDTGLAKGENSEGDSYRVVTASATGAAIFYVIGLNAARDEIDEFVVLNGDTAVSTLQSYFRQFRARVFLAGSLNGAAGTITSTAQIDLSISCVIVNGNNQTLMSIYTIPRGKTGYLQKWWGSMSKKQSATSVYRLRIGQFNGISYIRSNRAINSDGSSDFNYEFTAPLTLPEGVDVYIEANTDAVNSAVAGGFLIILKDN